VLAARSADKIRRLAQDVGGVEHARAVPYDVSQWADRQAMMAAMLERFGRLDAVLANAAVLSCMPLTSHPILM
jgi:NAD(P)-dependent dehydrogenase (short-subunit alcohol dehydrogenase family)